MQTPSVTSPALVSCILLNKFSHDARNSLPLPGIPSRFFSWDEAIVTAAADIKPAVTGTDMNSTRKPDRKTEIHIWINFNCMLPYYCIFQAALPKLFFFIIKQIRCTNFTNLFWHETLRVSDSSSAHHQQFIIILTRNENVVHHPCLNNKNVSLCMLIQSTFSILSEHACYKRIYFNVLMS